MNKPTHVQFLMAILLATTIAGADTISFTPDSGGFWNIPGNWDLGRIPARFDEVRIVADSANHNKTVTYNYNGTDVFDTVTIDSTTDRYAMLLHEANVLRTDDMRIGRSGIGYHWMEDDAYLWVMNILYVGYYDYDQGEGHFYLDVSGSGSGVEVDSHLYVGYHGEGFFEHVSGQVNASHLFVGQNAPGTYWLSGSESNSSMNTNYYIVIGNGDTGLFEQTGGSVSANSTLYLGLNSGGNGTYLLKGGSLSTDNITVGMGGKGTYRQSGGTCTCENITIGASSTNPSSNLFEINSDNEPATLTASGTITVGKWALGTYEQNGGTVTVAEKLKLHDNDQTDSEYGTVHLGPNAGTLSVEEEIINSNGYFHQEDGTVTTQSFTSNSPQGTLIEGDALLETRYLNNQSGTFSLMDDAYIRGPLAFPPSTYWVCDFTNDSIFTMGSSTRDGGMIYGTITNNGLINYHAGDLTACTIVNNGTFNNFAPMTCRKITNTTAIHTTSTRPITIQGLDDIAIDNQGNFLLYNTTWLELNGGTLLNTGTLKAGGLSTTPYTTIAGNVINEGLLQASVNDDPGILRIEGDYTASSDAEHTIRLGGTRPADEHDQIWITGTAELGGELNVTLANGFNPSYGDSFVIMAYNELLGEFDTIRLPLLLQRKYWRVEYHDTVLILVVTSRPLIPGDCDDDGDIDLDDFADFGQCMQGPDVPVFGDCDCYRLDDDNDVDLQDYAIFQQLFAGS